MRGTLMAWNCPTCLFDVSLEDLEVGIIGVVKVAYLPWMLRFSPSTSGSPGIRR